MKVLVINHPEGDFGASLVFNGLLEQLGPANVYEYPPKLSYHGQVHHYALPTIPNGMTAPYPWSRTDPSAWADPSSAEAEVRDMLCSGLFSFVLVESMRHRALEAFHALRSLIRDAKIPVILMEGEDYWEIDWALVHSVSPNVFLKRELRTDRYPSVSFVHDGVRVIGFPFSTPSRIEAAAAGCVGMPTLYDVSFMCGQSVTYRQQVINALRTMTDLRVHARISPDDTAGTGPLESWGRYVEIMARSTVCISALGVGNDTLRFWEAVACGFVLSQPLGLHYENPFVPGAHYEVYNSLPEMQDKIRHFAAHPDEASAMHAAALDHLHQYHTNAARARRIIALAKEYGAAR